MVVFIGIRVSFDVMCCNIINNLRLKEFPMESTKTMAIPVYTVLLYSVIIVNSLW